MKRTNKAVNDRIAELQKEGMDVAVNFQGFPSQPQITTKDGAGELSPRLPAQEAYLWLDGYVKGVQSK